MYASGVLKMDENYLAPTRAPPRTSVSKSTALLKFPGWYGRVDCSSPRSWFQTSALSAASFGPPTDTFLTSVLPVSTGYGSFGASGDHWTWTRLQHWFTHLCRHASTIICNTLLAGSFNCKKWGNAPLPFPFGISLLSSPSLLFPPLPCREAAPKTKVSRGAL